MTQPTNRLIVVFTAATLMLGAALVWNPGPTNAAYSTCRDSDPHVIFSFSSEKGRQVVADLLLTANVPQTGHVSSKGDQKIYGDIALVVDTPKDLKRGQPTIVFEADIPRICAEQVAKIIGQSTSVIEGKGGFVFVPLKDDGIVVGFRPRGALIAK